MHLENLYVQYIAVYCHSTGEFILAGFLWDVNEMCVCVCVTDRCWDDLTW